MPPFARFASLTCMLIVSAHVPAFASAIEADGSWMVGKPESRVAVIRLAQAAGPTTAGGTLPYISSPDSKPSDVVEVPGAKQQATSTPPSDAAPKPDVADQGQVKRLIDPDLIAKQRKSAPNPQPGAMPATGPAATPTEAKTPATPAEVKAPPAPTEANAPSLPADAQPPTTTAEPVPAPTAPSDKPAANTAETPIPAPTAPSQPQQDQATTTPAPAPIGPEATQPNVAKVPAKQTDKPKVAKAKRPADVVAHDHPVTDAYYYKGRPRRYGEAYPDAPVPPLGIPAPSHQLYADRDETVIVRRVRPVCRTYVYHDFIFPRYVTRCY
ncbi:MAG: hypothetical protein P4L98_11220 [Ancalomicrobiaceae bacterium]|nr:hypothetical protein [Ancalomicrobiaceae bacterium]